MLLQNGLSRPNSILCRILCYCFGRAGGAPRAGAARPFEVCRDYQARWSSLPGERAVGDGSRRHDGGAGSKDKKKKSRHVGGLFETRATAGVASCVFLVPLFREQKDRSRIDME